MAPESGLGYYLSCHTRDNSRGWQQLRGWKTSDARGIRSGFQAYSESGGTSADSSHSINSPGQTVVMTGGERSTIVRRAAERISA